MLYPNDVSTQPREPGADGSACIRPPARNPFPTTAASAEPSSLYTSPSAARFVNQNIVHYFSPEELEDIRRRCVPRPVPLSPPLEGLPEAPLVAQGTRSPD